MNVSNEDKKALEEAIAVFKETIKGFEDIKKDELEKVVKEMINIASKIGIKIGFDEAIEKIKEKAKEMK